MSTFTHPVLPDCVTAMLVGDNLYLTVKSPERLEQGRLYHSELKYRVNRYDFADAVDELPQPCHINILLPALDCDLICEKIVWKPMVEAS